MPAVLRCGPVVFGAGSSATSARRTRAGPTWGPSRPWPPRGAGRVRRPSHPSSFPDAGSAVCASKWQEPPQGLRDGFSMATRRPCGNGSPRTSAGMCRAETQRSSQKQPGWPGRQRAYPGRLSPPSRRPPTLRSNDHIAPRSIGDGRLSRDDAFPSRLHPEACVSAPGEIHLNTSKPASGSIQNLLSPLTSDRSQWS